MDHNTLLRRLSSSAKAHTHRGRVLLSAHHSNSPSSHAHKRLSTIIFASIGGVIALVLLALCMRRLIIHSRIPRQNTVLTDEERARLVREIAECEAASRRYWKCHGPPPPPYEHAPSYDLLPPGQT
ncbi:hypothetical protein EI94DRAFT_1734370 [Lactarius quietus]|nr:hypothetical protein EI94DRAFT_1734370 [Lactarius quietus]